MRQLLPTYRAEVSDEQLREAYAYPRTGRRVRANMVVSVDGAVTLDGSSRPLSSAPDRAVFRLLRSLSDVVLVGAGTARAEDYRPMRASPEQASVREALGLAPAPVLALVSRRLDLDPASPMFSDGWARPVVVTCGATDDKARDRLSEVADVLVVGTDSVDLSAAVTALEERGLRRILCEGGPQLLGDMAAVGLLDELCLTVSPVLVGGDEPRLMSAPLPSPRSMTLASVVTEDDVLLLRYSC